MGGGLHPPSGKLVGILRCGGGRAARGAGPRRRWARRMSKHLIGDVLAGVPSARQLPRGIVWFRCEAEILLEDKEEAVLLQPFIQREGDQDILRTRINPRKPTDSRA